MSPVAIYYILDDYINQVLLVFNCILFFSLIKNRKNADVPVHFDGERYYFDFSKKTLSGNIDVCILSSKGRVEPLYALSMGVGSSK
jgi:hypothetical protein